MKKFLLTLCVSTPLVKGIYAALFILILTTTASAQIELKDNTTVPPYPKWEVGVDLKPLFRSDEPYNLFVKRYLTETKALRFRLSAFNFQFQDDSLNIVETKTTNGQQILQFYQLKRNKNVSSGFGVSFGYQSEMRKGILSLYSATDLSYNTSSDNLLDGGGAQGGDSGQIKPFEGYRPIIAKDIRINDYGVLQSLGVKYYLCKQISLSIEATLKFTYSTFSLDYLEHPYTDLDFVKHTNLKGKDSNISFVPLMGLYLNYHF